MRMNTEQVPKPCNANADPASTRGRLTSCVKRAKEAAYGFAGAIGDGMSGERVLWQHGKSRRAIWRKLGQPTTREGEVGLGGMAERPLLPKKLGNAGGGKGP